MTPEEIELHLYDGRFRPYDTPEGRARAPQWLKDLRPGAQSEFGEVHQPITAAARPTTNPTFFINRKLVRRMQIIGVLAGAAVTVDLEFLVFSHASEPRRVIVGLLSAGGLAVLSWAWLSRMAAVRSILASYVGLAASSPQLRSRKSRRALSGAETRARYGNDQEPHNRRARTSAAQARLTFCALSLFLLVSVNFYSLYWPWLLTVVIVVAGGWGVRALSATQRRAAALAISCMAQAAGVPDLEIETVPWTPEQYIAWCQGHGVEPYPFRRS